MLMTNKKAQTEVYLEVGQKDLCRGARLAGLVPQRTR
jgi:hypothetical protein